VLHSTTHVRDQGNPYNLLLMDAMPADVQAVGFSWGRALLGRYQVVHLHWPELLLRDPDPRRQAVKRLLAGLLVLRWTVLRTPIVQTVHNLTPHESTSRYERAVLALLTRRTRAWIKLNPLPVPIDGVVVEIPHGHYRDWFADLPRAPRVPGRLLFFGLIRPYKRVGRLLDAFLAATADRAATDQASPDQASPDQGAADQDAAEPRLSLRIVGACSDPDVQARVLACQQERDDVSAQFAFVPDARLAQEITASELVVLPYQDFYNSGAVLLALSLGRPVLTPRTPATELLQQEFGPQWVRLFDDPLTGEALRAALRGAVAGRGPAGDGAGHRAAEAAPEGDRPGRDALPDLSRREWDGIGRAHAALYRAAARGQLPPAVPADSTTAAGAAS
jgi:beta-1,4-mannosyltransferase